MKMIRWAGAVVAIWVGAALSARAESVSIQSPGLRVEARDKPFSLLISDRSGRILLETIGGLRFTTVSGQKGPFDRGIEEAWTEAGEVISLNAPGNRIQADLAARPGQPVQARFLIFFLNDQSLRVEAEVVGKPAVNRIALKFKSAPEDRYFGMGERFNSAEHRGERVYNWTQEGCLINCQNTSMTYFPVPFFLNPKGYGFLLDDSHYSEFDFAKSDPKILELFNWNRKLEFMIFYGPQPLSVIEAYTNFTGRVSVPPPWAFGTWVAATAAKLQGTSSGPEHVRKVARDCRENHIPCSAVWSEDWAWTNPVTMIYSNGIQWDLNRQRYPDYERLAGELHQDGFKFLSYFAPYLGAGSPAFQQAADQGYLAKAQGGGPAEFRWLLPKVGEPDLTNPQAREWWEKTFFWKAVDYGVDGWMHDFSEYTPVEAQFSDGRDGWAVHNDYPRLWAMTAREFWDRARPDGDYVFFMRAGWTGSWKYAPVMWTGDQSTNWGKADGLASVIPGVNSAGISGAPIAATDIAGYHCVTTPATDKELFFRWTQLGALLPVMRTHESSGCPNNWLFNSDRETLLLFKKYAALHTSLFPYLYTLAYESAAKGWPMVRHLMLQYPDDPGSLQEEYEFMLGDRILVAPVIENRAREREVYFPPGEWVSWWDGKHYKGCADKSVRTTNACGPTRVPAPLEQIPLFVKNGTLVPLFDSRIDTLAKESRPDLNGWDDANQTIKVLFFGEGKDDYVLWDGTAFHCESAGKSCQASKGPERKYSFEFR